MPDKNDFSEIIAELLRAQDRTNEKLEKIDNSMDAMRKESKENTDRAIYAFNHFAEAVLKRLGNIDSQIVKIADIDEHLKRLEVEVFKKVTSQ